MSHHLSERLPSKLDEFRCASLFNDVVLVSGGSSHACQRILLARHCGWFERYFVAHPIPYGATLTVEVPNNPDDVLPLFLALLYTGQCELTLATLPPLLSMAVFYDSPLLCEVIRHFVRLAIRDEPLKESGHGAAQENEQIRRGNESRRHNLLPLAREFRRLDLDADGMVLAPPIAHLMKRLFLRGPRPPFTLADVYGSVSPKVFAAILNDPAMRDPAVGLCDDDLVGLIDAYVGDRAIDREEDREALAGVVSWTSHRHLVRHRCDWLPARLARPLLSSVIRVRGKIEGRMVRDLAPAPGTVSRWHLFAWLQAIRDGRVDPSVRVVEFISTLGGTADQFDPRPFGLLRAFTSVDPIAPDFDVSTLFQPGRYFMALPTQGLAPIVGIDLGPDATMAVDEVVVDTACPTKHFQHPPKPTAASVVVRLSESEDGCKSADAGQIVVGLVGGKAEEAIADAPRCSAVAVEFRSANSSGFELARLSGMDFKVHFVAQ